VLSAENKMVVKVSKLSAYGTYFFPAPIEFEVNSTSIQPYDVILVVIGSEKNYIYIAEPVTPTQARIDYGSMGDSLIGDYGSFHGDSCIQRAGSIVANLFWAGLPHTRILAEMLGYPLRDLWFLSSPVVWTPWYQLSLAWPKYVLVELEFQSVSGQQAHQQVADEINPTRYETLTWNNPDPTLGVNSLQVPVSANNVLKRIIMKCLLNVSTTVERYLPNKVFNLMGSRIRQITIRILNPDHSLYQLHGQEWSLALGFFSRAIEEPQFTCI
jgi:hypothetical protein